MHLIKIKMMERNSAKGFKQTVPPKLYPIQAFLLSMWPKHETVNFSASDCTTWINPHTHAHAHACTQLPHPKSFIVSKQRIRSSQRCLSHSILLKKNINIQLSGLKQSESTLFLFEFSLRGCFFFESLFFCFLATVQATLWCNYSLLCR